MFVPILAYHKIQDKFDFSITRIAPQEFEKQIRFLASCGYSSTSVIDFLKGKRRNEKHVIITFDDAYECIFEYALPVLSRYNFTATIFIVSDFVGHWNEWDYNFFKIKSKHCDWAQLRILATEGWEIGSHTATHRNLSSLCDQQIWDELMKSKNTLEDEICTPVKVISYPFGRFNPRVLNLVKKAGYKGGCTLGYSADTGEFQPYTLSRRGVYLREPFNLFKVKLNNNALSHYDDLKQQFITFCSQGSILLRYLQSHKISLD